MKNAFTDYNITELLTNNTDLFKKKSTNLTLVTQKYQRHNLVVCANQQTKFAGL